MTLYFTLHIYKHKLGHPEVLTVSPLTFISSSGASGVNLVNLAMAKLPAGILQPSGEHLEMFLKIYYKSMEIIN